MADGRSSVVTDFSRTAEGQFQGLGNALPARVRAERADLWQPDDWSCSGLADSQAKLFIGQWGTKVKRIWSSASGR